MAKQSRLRVQKEKKRRWVLVFVFFIAVIAVGFWQFDKKDLIINWAGKVLLVIKGVPVENSLSRGTIYDRNLKQIAVTMDRVSVYVRTKEIESIPETVEALGAILSVNKEKLQKKLETGSLRVWVAKDINQDEEIEIKKEGLPGIYLQRKQIRFYPNGTYAAHLTGYVDGNMGLAGVEFFYDRLLARMKVGGKPKRTHLDHSQDLVLTVDLKIQKILEELVSDIGNWSNVTKVAAYIMEGATGEIVGGAQYPDFDPNNFTKYSQDVLENIFLNPTVIPDKFRLLLRDAASLYSSSESGLAMLPWSIRVVEQNLGFQLRLWEWLGLTEQWSADFSAYDKPSENRKTPYTPFLTSQRQSYGLVPEYASPLKILTAMTGLLGGGERIRPHVVLAVADAETGEKFHLPPYQGSSKEFAKIIKKNAKEMEQLFKSQADSDSSGTLFLGDSNLLVAPLTKEQKFMTSEMLFVSIPAGSLPLTMLVLIERRAEFPGAKMELQRESVEKRVGKIVDRISVLQQVAKTVSDVVEVEKWDDANYPLIEPGETSVPDNLNKLRMSREAKGMMPDLTGLSLRRSLQLLQDNNIKIRFQGTGRVVSQNPPAGTVLSGVSECVLILEKVEDMQLERMESSGF